MHEVEAAAQLGREGLAEVVEAEEDVGGPLRGLGELRGGDVEARDFVVGLGCGDGLRPDAGAGADVSDLRRRGELRGDDWVDVVVEGPVAWSVSQYSL